MEYKESTDYLRTAAEAYLGGNASEEQEKSLRVFLSGSDGVGLSRELCALKVMLEGAEALSKVSFDTEVFVDACQKARHQGAWKLKFGGAIAAAAAIAVAALVFTPTKQQVYGYDINGEAITNIDQALDNMASMNLLSELENSTNEAEYILNTILGE